MPTENITLPELIEKFGSEDACHLALEELRWPRGVFCPRCESKSISRITKRRAFDCDKCRYQFSVRVGTIFEDSKLPLWKWFLAVYMMVQSKKSVSANQLKRMLGVSYKTAWYLCHRIRKAMAEDSPSWLRGIVEVDETFVGGKRRGTGLKKGLENKTIVAGAVERGGKVRLKMVPNRSKRTLKKFIDDNVHDRDTEFIYTDDHKGYADLGEEHRTIVKESRPGGKRSGRHQWVHGKVHTNTIEGVWSLLDRSILGAYHKVSKKHLPAYLHEVEWRYNNRQNPYLFRDTMLELVRCERLEYKKLTA